MHFPPYLPGAVQIGMVPSDNTSSCRLGNNVQPMSCGATDRNNGCLDAVSGPPADVAKTTSVVTMGTVILAGDACVWKMTCGDNTGVSLCVGFGFV